MFPFVLQHILIEAHGLAKLPVQDVRMSEIAFHNQHKPLRVLSLIQRNGELQYCNGFFHLLEREQGCSLIEQHQTSRPMIGWQECERLARQLDGARMVFSKPCRRCSHSRHLTSKLRCYGIMYWERCTYPLEPG